MTETTRHVRYASPIGDLLLESRGDRISGLHMLRGSADPRLAEAELEVGGSPILDEARRQLDAYFDGRSQSFDLPLFMSGTPFQEKVWKALAKVPYGETVSYADLARKIGKPSGSRAVGGANGRNCIAIVIPCHRVIAAGGRLGGFGGGLDRKLWLLQHEAHVLGREVPAAWADAAAPVKARPVPAMPRPRG